MAQITAENIETTYVKNGRFTISRRIQSAIEGCITNDDQALIEQEYKRLSGEYKAYRKILRPIQIDYGNELTLDAYVIYYLSRNTLIPIIAFRDLSFNPFFQRVPDSVNILDLGTGTGAVVLGLFELFNMKSLSDVAINIVAIDRYGLALERQRRLIDKAGFNSSQVKRIAQDLNDVEKCIKLVREQGPYNFIFIANCLTELERHIGEELVSKLPPLIRDDGAIVIAEAQRDYIKRIIQKLATNAQGYGLNIYYPCPIHPTCTTSSCWVWRDHEYECPSIKVGGEYISEIPRDRLTLSWLILTRAQLSIYDIHIKRAPKLLWRPIAQVKNRQWGRPLSGWCYGACDGNEVETFEEDDGFFPSYKRGSIVGLSDELELEEYRIL